MKKLVLAITTVTLVMTMAFSVSAKSTLNVSKITSTTTKVKVTFPKKAKYKLVVKVNGKTAYKKKIKKRVKKVTIKIKKQKSGARVVFKATNLKTKKSYKKTVKVVGVVKKTSTPQYEDTGYSEQEWKEIIKRNQENQLIAKDYEAQGLKEGEDFYWGMFNGKEVCMLKYTNTYIDDEVLQLLENDRKEVAEKSKTDPYYEIDRSPLFKEKVYYGVGDKGEGFGILFVGKLYIEYGLYSDTGELPTPEHYSYKKIKGILVDGEEYEGYDIRKKNYKYETNIGYDVFGNLVEIGRGKAWIGD